MASLGVSGLELDFRLTGNVLKDLLTESRKLNLSILSIHAVCPASPGKANINFSETHQLSSADEDTRRLAVRDVKKTLELASETGAGAVVVHCGSVPMENVTGHLHKMYSSGQMDSDDGKREINDLKIGRLSQRGNTFDQLLKSLEELNTTAERLGVPLCLENRYHMTEYPNYEELAVIFMRMSGSNIGYWHDAGHAQVQENLGLLDHIALLEEFKDVLKGIHLHDVSGYSDHFAPPTPGPGAVNFEMLKKYVAPDTIRIMELRGDISEGEARKGAGWLRSQGF